MAKDRHRASAHQEAIAAEVEEQADEVASDGSEVEGRARPASKGARSKTVAFVSLVSNVECEPAEVDAWVARRFSGDVDTALAWIEAAPVPDTARKRPGPAVPSGAPPAKKKRGGGA